jgi:succinate-semialdehyde dehydrogenase/glutarate-semialdehyde dehydrogenase
VARCRMGRASSIRPRCLSNVPETADCVHDEIFGPVAAIQTFTDQDDAIRRANDTEYGLVAYVSSPKT